ncbi:hypothetical protein [Burkholderia pseudomallei]|uniref:hypothetical protein n=1 Tax=Burkholderia pseudomallei TaxID=28450 RepID=UPI00190B11EB|nr:hypothetical protein [Burkholderia pseudomallei]MBK3333536.1 hypothetical protein [Burkholderia pseudomallei]
MTLGPLPPKPPLLPPFWWLAPLAAFISGFALAMNVSCAYDFARASSDGWVAFHCGLMAWMLMAFVYDVQRTIKSFREWAALRAAWEAARKWRDELERRHENSH